MSKRRRITTSHTFDKHLISVVQSISASQVTTNMFTVIVPGTLTGLRWFISVEPLALGSAAWALVQVRDTVIVSTMIITNGAQFYSPEQDVLAFGRFATGSTGPD